MSKKKVGFTIPGSIVVETAAYGDVDAAVEAAAEKWEQLSDEEKLEILNADKATFGENVIYVDEVDDDGNVEQVLAEW